MSVACMLLWMCDQAIPAPAQVIARSGNTGYSGAPHLHFDVVDR